VNVRVDRFTVDFIWRRSALIVETDGYRFHRGRQAFEDDRARDLKLGTLGFEVVRLTYRQILDEPVQTADLIRTLIRRRLGLLPPA